MNSQVLNVCSRRLAILAALFLALSVAWAEESPKNSPAGGPEKAAQAGRVSRLMKGLARPFGSDSGKAVPANPPADRANAAPAAGPEKGAVPSTPREQYILRPDDVLAINVWQEPQISRNVPVRPDGKISLPLAGEIEASGLTPLKLQAKITEALKPFLSNPEVTVIVEKVNLPKFNILGEVLRPGSYDVAKGMNVLDAIAVGGGFREFAKVKDIYVLRRTAGGSPVRLPFNYKDIMKGKNFSQNVELESGDTVVVP